MLLEGVSFVAKPYGDGDDENDGQTHNVLDVAMPLEFVACKQSRLISCLGVIDSASAPDDGPVERQHPSSLEELDSIDERMVSQA